MVEYLKRRFNVQFIYCWHGLPAYWSGECRGVCARMCMLVSRGGGGGQSLARHAPLVAKQAPHHPATPLRHPTPLCAGVSPDAPLVAKYAPRVQFAKPTDGLFEIEPSMAWNPGVLGGIGIASNPDALFGDMHSYLADAGGWCGVGVVGCVLRVCVWLFGNMHSCLAHAGGWVLWCGWCGVGGVVWVVWGVCVARRGPRPFPRPPTPGNPSPPPPPAHHLQACLG